MLKYLNFLLDPLWLVKKCQFHIVTAAVIAGVAGLAGSAMSSSSASKSAKATADANLRATQETNRLNERLFNQSRGAPGIDGYGHAIMPNYFGGDEEAMARSAYDNFNRLSGLGQTTFGQLNEYQTGMNPALGASMAAFQNRFNGQDLSQRVGFSSPFYGARTSQANIYGQGLRDIAGANSSAISTGLAQTLARMNQQRAAQGFFGGSTFDRNRMGMATIGARQAAAVGNAQANAGANNAAAGAAFDNAGDLRALQMSDLDFRGRLDAFPGAMNALSAYQSAPANALAGSFGTAMQPLNYFRLQPQAFQAQNMPMQEPGISSGQIFGSALSQAGQTYGNYAMMNQMMNRWGTQPGAQNPSNTSMPVFNNTGSMAPNYGLASMQMPQQPAPYFNYKL